MLNIVICGVNGKMGQVTASTVTNSADARVVAGIDLFPDAQKNDFPVYKDASECKESVDVIIDFSRPCALRGNLDFANSCGAALIICTTGYTPEEKQLMVDYSEKIPVFFSANMSPGVNLQMELCKQTALFFGRDIDIEIVEEHHNLKVDAPSGTALALADSINDGLKNEMSYTYGRTPDSGKRTDKEIGIHAVRGGSIVGTHKVMYIGDEEIFEITHAAQNKQVFAVGALRAARFMQGKPAGYYSMTDIVSETRAVMSVDTSKHEAVINLIGINNNISDIAKIFSSIAEHKISVDIITQSAPTKDLVDVSFSLNESDVDNAISVIQALGYSPNAITDLAKIVVAGIGMEHKWGVAAELFSTLANQQIDMQILTTSQRKISFCVKTDLMAKAEQAVASAFGLN